MTECLLHVPPHGVEGGGVCVVEPGQGEADLLVLLVTRQLVQTDLGNN